MLPAPTITPLPETLLAGHSVQMCFAQNQTPGLWQGFMPLRNNIPHTANAYLYSVEIYPAGFFNAFNPQALFTKWAAVAVTAFANLPQGVQPLTVPAGLYAVFAYKGTPAGAAPFYRQIHETWLPQSGYVLHNRPHFALMGANYRHNHPDSEEEIWIPIGH